MFSFRSLSAATYCDVTLYSEGFKELPLFEKMLGFDSNKFSQANSFLNLRQYNLTILVNSAKLLHLIFTQVFV